MESRLKEGRFKNASEVIRAGLKLLEEEESRLEELREAIARGDERGLSRISTPVNTSGE